MSEIEDPNPPAPSPEPVPSPDPAPPPRPVPDPPELTPMATTPERQQDPGAHGYGGTQQEKDDAGQEHPLEDPQADPRQDHEDDREDDDA